VNSRFLRCRRRASVQWPRRHRLDPSEPGACVEPTQPLRASESTRQGGCQLQLGLIPVVPRSVGIGKSQRWSIFPRKVVPLLRPGTRDVPRRSALLARPKQCRTRDRTPHAGRASSGTTFEFVAVFGVVSIPMPQEGRAPDCRSGRSSDRRTAGNYCIARRRDGNAVMRDHDRSRAITAAGGGIPRH
jgi:hypothetical protein